MMYVNPVLFGIGITLFTEIAIILVYSLFRGKDNEDKDDKSDK